jgi:hypothetical protein
MKRSEDAAILDGVLSSAPEARWRLEGVLLAFEDTADFCKAACLRSQREVPVGFTPAVVRLASCSNSARSAAVVGLLKVDIVLWWKSFVDCFIRVVCFDGEVVWVE